MVILTKSGRYTYFGNLDENNCRTGRGRTVSPDGMTSYDGEYLDDRRNGFGVCYYNNGSINYVGNWTDNSRNGGGVGYRLSDGTMHAVSGIIILLTAMVQDLTETEILLM